MKSIALASIAVLTLGGCIADVAGEPGEGDEEAGVETTTIDVRTTKKQLAYVVIPHPDDEFEAWSMIEKSADNYPVFVLMTHGEETNGCTLAGKDWYQGNLGEYVSGNPWQGKWNPACDAARLASYHLFLDRMAQVDPSLPYKPGYVGRFCFDGKTTDGTAPSRIDNGVRHTSACAEVYASALGARVIFDLGDTDLTSAEVIWALQAVRTNRAQLSIPRLPEFEVLAAAFYNATAPGSGTPAYSDCDYYGHPDHHAIHAALWNTHVGAGPQYARTCDSDPDVAATSGRTSFVDTDTQAAAFEVDATTKQRRGASAVAYGWLNPTYYDTCTSGCGFSRKQSFWKR
jgi:LmbE family N-acetylglucosaminyl deacetylase